MIRIKDTIFYYPENISSISKGKTFGKRYKDISSFMMQVTMISDLKYNFLYDDEQELNEDFEKLNNQLNNGRIK